MNPVPKPPRPAKKPRAWNSTLAVAEAKARPRKKKLVASDARALRSKPIARKSPPKKRRRSASETERVYGSKAFRDHLHSSPCLWCGRVSGIEAAHLRGNGGLSKKKDWTTTGPLCGGLRGPNELPPCHSRWDCHTATRHWFTDAQRTSILLRLDAFHERWSHLNGESK